MEQNNNQPINENTKVDTNDNKKEEVIKKEISKSSESNDAKKKKRQEEWSRRERIIGKEELIQDVKSFKELIKQKYDFELPEDFTFEELKNLQEKMKQFNSIETQNIDYTKKLKEQEKILLDKERQLKEYSDLIFYTKDMAFENMLRQNIEKYLTQYDAVDISNATELMLKLIKLKKPDLVSEIEYEDIIRKQGGASEERINPELDFNIIKENKEKVTSMKEFVDTWLSQHQHFLKNTKTGSGLFVNQFVDNKSIKNNDIASLVKYDIENRAKFTRR